MVSGRAGPDGFPSLVENGRLHNEWLLPSRLSL
jgi:hypothetical protein